MKLEVTIQTRILHFLNTEATQVYHVPTKAARWLQFDGRQKGNPDIICSFGGHLVLLEVKRSPKEKPTKLQKATIKQWAESGATALVVSSVEEVQEILTQIQNYLYKNKEGR